MTKQETLLKDTLKKRQQKSLLVIRGSPENIDLLLGQFREHNHLGAELQLEVVKLPGSWSSEYSWGCILEQLRYIIHSSISPW